MSHSLLPQRERRHTVDPLDAHYLDEALRLFEASARRAGTTLREYQVKLFGGGDMFPGGNINPDGRVGKRNIDQARRMLADCGLHTSVEKVGGLGHRAIIMDLWSGDLWFKHP